MELGPGSYNPPISLENELIRKIQNGYKGNFGSMEKRFDERKEIEVDKFFKNDDLLSITYRKAKKCLVLDNIYPLVLGKCLLRKIKVMFLNPKAIGRPLLRT